MKEEKTEAFMRHTLLPRTYYSIKKMKGKLELF